MVFWVILNSFLRMLKKDYSKFLRLLGCDVRHLINHSDKFFNQSISFIEKLTGENNNCD